MADDLSGADALQAVLDLLDAGDVAAARTRVRDALEQRPGDALLWSVAGLCARLADDTADAECCWRRSVELQPSASACNHLGELLAGADRLAEALDCYATAAEAGVADAVGWGNLGLLRMQAGETDAAEQA